MSWEVRGYLSEIQRKNWSQMAVARREKENNNLWDTWCERALDRI